MCFFPFRWRNKNTLKPRENATFFSSFPGRSLVTWAKQGPANQELFHSDQQGCEAWNAGWWVVQGPMGGHLFLNGERPCCEFFSENFHSCFLKKFQVVNSLGWWENFLVYVLDSRPVFWDDFFKVISRYGVTPQSYESAMATEKFTLKVRNFWINTPCCSSMGWKHTGEWMGWKMIRPFFLWEGVVGADEASGKCHLKCVRVGINLSRCHPPKTQIHLAKILGWVDFCF